MSLNTLILSDLLVADLYKQNLVSIQELTAAITPKQEPLATRAIQFLGKHLQKITILVDYPGETYLPDTSLNFLANILKACNLNLADIAIINLAKQELSFQQIKSELGSKKMIIFDIEPARLDIDAHAVPFSIEFYSEVSLLKSPALEKLNQANEEGKLLKSKLWLCLKELFGVS